MEGRCELQGAGWCLLLPGQADGLVATFPTKAAAEQALRLVALHSAIAAGRPYEELQRLRAELEVHDPGCCNDEAMEDLRHYSKKQLMDMLRATAAGSTDSEGATASTAAAPRRTASTVGDGSHPWVPLEEWNDAQLEAEVAGPQRPQQHELLQEPGTQPQQEAQGVQATAPQQAAPQQPGQDAELPSGFYHHYFGVVPKVPRPSATSYKAQLVLLVGSGGQPQRPSTRAGGKTASSVCLLACPTQGEAAAARDLGTLWRVHRLSGLRGGGPKQHGPLPLFNFDRSRWEQDQPELLAAVRQCKTLQQLQQLLAVCMANGTLHALGSSLPRDAASWQVATRQAAGGDSSKRWRPSLKRALAQLASGRHDSWSGVQLGVQGGAALAGEGRDRRRVRLARSVSPPDSYGYDSEPAAEAAEAAAPPSRKAQSAGAAQAIAAGLQEGQRGPSGSSLATEGTEGTADELESDYLGVRRCPGVGWRSVVAVRLDGLGAPSLAGSECLHSFELASELEAALVRDLGLLWYEQWCGPESFQEYRLWNFALRRYLLDGPLWNVLSQLPNWPSFESYVVQLQASGQLAEAAKAYDDGQLSFEWPDPQFGLPADQQPPPPKQQRQVRRQRRQQQQQGEARATVGQRGRRTRQHGARSRRQSSPGVTTAEAAAAARACKAAAEAAAAAAPPEACEQMAAVWRQQSQKQAEEWEAAVQPYDTGWLLQGSQLQLMLCPPPANSKLPSQPANPVGSTVVPASCKRTRPAAASVAAGVHGASAAQEQKQQERRREQQQRPRRQPQQRAQQSLPKQLQHMGQQQTHLQEQQQQLSVDEAATAMPRAVQPAATGGQREQPAPQPAEGCASPAQHGTPPAATEVRVSPAVPAVPGAHPKAASQLHGPAAADLRALLERLPVLPHATDGQGTSPRHPPPVPAAGDVLLYCRRTNGFAGLPLLERLLVVSVAALDPPSPRVSHRCRCLLLGHGASPQLLKPPVGDPELRVVEVRPSGFKSKVWAVSVTSRWSVLGHVAGEPMDAIPGALALLKQQ